MNDLKAVSAIVKTILTQAQQARDDDNVLYLMVLQHVSNRNSIDLKSMTVPVFLLKMKEYGLPGFETVRRSRQKVQADNPELEGTESGVREPKKKPFIGSLQRARCENDDRTTHKKNQTAQRNDSEIPWYDDGISRKRS